MSPEARDQSFDELTRGLASGNISRGKALRLMGAALLGGTLASFPGVAWAAKGGGGGQSSCAHFCQSLFGSSTPEEEECVSQGTKGQGPCFTCTTQTGCGPNFTEPPCTVTGQTYNCSTCQCECTSIGGTCTADTQCCTGMCDERGGTCVCTPVGQSCSADSECCIDNCDSSSGKCAPACVPNGDSCFSSRECCSANCDSSSGKCAACRPTGDSCFFSSECCSANCSNGICCDSGRVGISNGSCVIFRLFC